MLSSSASLHISDFVLGFSTILKKDPKPRRHTLFLLYVSDLDAQALVDAAHAGPTVTLGILLQCCVQLPASCCCLSRKWGMAQHRHQVTLRFFFLPTLHSDCRGRFRGGMTMLDWRAAGGSR